MEQQPPVTLKERFWTQATRTDVLVSLGTAAVSTGLLTWVAQRWTEVTGGSWPASIFLGLGATCVLVLVACAFMVSLRIFKPLVSKSPDQSKSGITDGAASMMLKLHKEVDSAIRGFESKLEREIPAANERLEAKISDLTKTMVNLHKGSTETLEKAVNNLEGQITVVNERIDAGTKSLRKENSYLAERINALKVFLEMSRLRRDIDRLTLLLERPLKQPKDAREWDAWGKRFKRFEGAINHFASLVAIYYPEEAAVLTRTEPKIYRMSDGDFAPENFPDPGTAHDFKTYRQKSMAYGTLAEGLTNMVYAKT